MDFEGDVLLFDSMDGGEISIENGEILCDKGFRTAAYLSLFGGEKDGSEWWGNSVGGEGDAGRLGGKFQSLVRGSPLSSKSLALAEDAAKRDLEWLVSEGIADSVEARAAMEGRGRIGLEIRTTKDGKAETNSFSVQWEEMKNGV